jgi:hypothetical protein
MNNVTKVIIATEAHLGRKNSTMKRNSMADD